MQELQTELRLRGVATEGKRKPELVELFDDLRKGIVNVPALLQGTPEASLTSLGLEMYEIAPTEPLHDIKGYLSNLIEELLKVATGKLLEKLEGIRQTVLGRDTIRCSDCRKAVILIVKTLNEFGSNRDLTEVFKTAAELTELLYSRESAHSSDSPSSTQCSIYPPQTLQCSIQKSKVNE